MPRRTTWISIALIIAGIACLALVDGPACRAQSADDEELRSVLDCPILFAKRPNYQGIHIYDTCYQWHPGGGLYILENPADQPEEHRIRPVIDATTENSLGHGIYFDPELSFDGTRVLFSFKGEPNGSSSIYEIGIDGENLRRVTNPESYCDAYKGSHGGIHDLTPAYLPDGRIVFTSTRYNGLVPCANKGVAILHVMNADGTDIHPISVNSETEFDPSMMDDGRILFGRWEYVDKTALTMQSLWSVYPDGTNETAVYANNMVFPEAILDARQVPGVPHLVCGSFTPHNSTPRGTIAMVDMRMGKNDPAAIFNFDTPDSPTNNRGNSCEPWPLDEQTVLHSTMIDGVNTLVLARRNDDDSVSRTVVYRDEIDCHTPIPLRPRSVPQLRPELADRSKPTGFLSVHDVYEGMPEVPRGSITHLRVIEETSRVSASPGGSIYNQTFSVSAALAFACKNYLGTVPVEEDGSALFEVPAGKAIYLQALDAEGRCVRNMRTFIQATPGTTRSCVGCHEDKKATFPVERKLNLAQKRAPSQLVDESWGSGPMDYASMVQPVLDEHCVGCHGGEKGVACGLDLSGGWTDFFSISYENLTSRREVQYKSTLIAGIDCMNGTAHYSAQILPAYASQSGAAPLAKIVVDGARGHADRLKDMPRQDRDLIMAWIDSNGLYNGTWDYTTQGCRLDGWQETKAELVAEMQAAGCAECHDAKKFEPDWFNLERPEMSRILRAPLAKGAKGHGLGLCRDRKANNSFQRLRMMTSGGYQHAVKPLDWFPAQEWQEWDESGEPLVSFDSTDDELYQRMLSIIASGRARALARPRVDMPGAEPIAGENRNIYPIPIPEVEVPLTAAQLPGGEVELTWPRNRHTWGLECYLYRGTTPDFEVSPQSRLAMTMLSRYVDADDQEPGSMYYALVLDNGTNRSDPIRCTIDIKPTPPPAQVQGLKATPGPGTVRLSWSPIEMSGVKYIVMSANEGSEQFMPIVDEPISAAELVDFAPPELIKANEATRTLPARRYRVLALNRRGVPGEMSEVVEAAPNYISMAPIFETSADSPDSNAANIDPMKAKLLAGAEYADGVFDFTQGGYAEYASRDEFNLGAAAGLTVDFDIRFTEQGQMPVVIGAGRWNDRGWFLQRFGDGWRWHVGGANCDGGMMPPIGQWVHMRATWDGRRAKLYQDGKLVADVPCAANRTPWNGPMIIGQYSGGVGPQYQTLAQMKNVKIYQRAVE